VDVKGAPLGAPFFDHPLSREEIPMPILLLVLLLGTLGFLWYRRKTTTLTRSCRWRQEGAGHWHCVACNGRSDQVNSPKHCARITD